MVTDLSTAIVQCLRLMLRPVIRFCMRRMLSIQDLNESCKVVFIEVAAEEMLKRGEKVNISRLAIMTGMHRRDVMRIYRDKDVEDRQAGLVTRIIGQWQQDPNFSTKARKARVLTIDGENSEFNQLVRSVSQDLHPGTVMFELERTGAVKMVRNGVKLVARTYIPINNPQEGFKLLARDAEDLMTAVEENIFNRQKIPNHHAQTEYDNIPVDQMDTIKKWFFKEGSALHQKARNFLAKFDRDVNAKVKGRGRCRVVIGSFSRIENQQIEESKAE